MTTSLMLTLLGATLAVLVSVSESKSPDVKERHIRSLRAQLKNLATERRFVGQLASDCGMECQERRRAARRSEEQLSEAKKRFMSLGASDCGSYECVLRKRAAMEVVKRFLTAKSEKQQRTVQVQPAATKRRHRRYLDLIMGSNPFDYSPPEPVRKQPWENNYGSYGWHNYYGDRSYSNNGDDDYKDDYYYYDYEESGSGSGHWDDDADDEDNGGDDDGGDNGIGR